MKMELFKQAGDLLEGDINGDAQADFTIELLAVTSLLGG